MSKPHENYALDPKPLGIGGQAEVFWARDKRTNTMVAFKRLLHSLRNDNDAIARMRREIEVQTAVQHRNVMPVFDHSESFYWYTMPVADKILGRLPTPVGDETLFQVIEDCANGLIIAHEQGYVHRDLTPNNILLITEGGDSRWVVSDWGLVRRHGHTTVVRTAPGQPFGTAGFSAPEMWDDAHSVDRRADVYSLGRVIAWCLTGQWPSPNLPLLPEGKWYELMRLTTILNSEQRVQDMRGVLELIERMKAPTKAVSKSPLTITSIKSLPGLTKVDTVLFKAICEASLKTSVDWVAISQIADIKEQLGISDEELSESINILADNFYIQGTPTLGSGLDFFQITTYGFERYASLFLPEFNNLIGQVLLAAANRNLQDNKAIADDLKQPLILVDYVLDVLASRNLIKLSKYIGGGVSVNEITAQGRRTARALPQTGQ